MSQGPDLDDMTHRFDAMLAQMESRMNRLCDDWDQRMNRLHIDKQVLLQNIDLTARSNGVETAALRLKMEGVSVKLDALYGNGSGRPGAVERLHEQVQQIGSKVMYGCGGVAAVVILVGWYLAGHR